LMMMNGRPNSSNASDMVPSRAAGLIVRRRRRRSIDRPTDRPLGRRGGSLTVLVPSSVLPSTNNTYVSYRRCLRC
jgi:hypothetical protein